MGVRTNGPLRTILGKTEISSTKTGRSSSYNKKALPFPMDSPRHKQGLDAICAMFADPWALGRAYSRDDLAGDVGDFILAIAEGEIFPIPASIYHDVVEPYLEAQLRAQEAAEVKAASQETVIADMTKKQLVAQCKSMGFTPPKKANRTQLLGMVQEAMDKASEEGAEESGEESDEENPEEAE